MTIRLFILTLILWFASLSLFAQDQARIDSLESLLKTKIDDTTRINTLNALAEKYSYQNPDSAIVFAMQAKEIAENTQDSKRLAIALGKLGWGFCVKGNYPKALKYYFKALKIDNEIGKKSAITINLGNIAGVYLRQGNHPKALEYYFKSLKIAEELSNKNFIATALGSIGIVYKNQGNYPKALDYYFKALKTAEELENKNLITIWFGNIGNVYADQNDYSKALEYYFKALEIAEELGNNSHIAAWLGGIGIVYKNQGDYTKSLEYYLKALNLSEKVGSKSGIAINLSNIGLLYTSQKKYSEAERYLAEALELAKDIEALNIVCQIEEMLSELYEQTGKAAKALEHYKLYIEARDSLINEKNTKEITQREMQYDFDKQQEKEKAEQEKKDAIADEELKREKTIGYAFMGGFGLLLVLAFVVFRSLQQKKKANKIITEQKEEVEHQKELVDEKNQEITDSITYAKRIQEAILPPDRLVKEYLKESFILYKPKDIVAGDFYWMEAIDDLVIFAAADCTGHGVPGAMVSVVCHNAMNRAVREFGLITPGQILDKTRELVIETFEKSDKEVKDGMDIALCSLNGNKLQYAGANNQLWIIREGEIIETKANKQPIGKCDNPLPFTTHSFDLEKGDTLYIFSDGYVDQFGGEKGKKFKAKAFRELLLSIQDKTMEEQRLLIDEAFESWKGSIEQVDDVCVIGVSI